MNSKLCCFFLRLKFIQYNNNGGFDIVHHVHMLTAGLCQAAYIYISQSPLRSTQSRLWIIHAQGTIHNLTMVELHEITIRRNKQLLYL